MLLDEPFGAIDAINREKLQDELLRIHEKSNKTFIFVTHDIREAFKLGTKVLIMDKGKVEQYAAPQGDPGAPGYRLCEIPVEFGTGYTDYGGRQGRYLMSDYIAYWVKYQEKFLTRAVEHLQIVGLTIVISIVLAVLITILIRKSRFRTRVVLQLFSVVYSIPSLALFAILIPFTGLGLKTTLIVLVAYNPVFAGAELYRGAGPRGAQHCGSGRGYGHARLAGVLEDSDTPGHATDPGGRPSGHHIDHRHWDHRRDHQRRRPGRDPL